MLDYKPWPYQEFITQKEMELESVGCYAEMGLGKTVATLDALYKLKCERFDMFKCLIIAPKKVAEATWTAEQGKWRQLQGLRVVSVTGSQNDRQKSLESEADVYVIWRDLTQRIVNYYKLKWPFDTVVLDESSSFKNPQAKRFRALKTVRPKIRRLIELTGTPAPRDLMDLWAQVYLLDGGKRLGRTLTTYREMYFLPDKRSAAMVYSYKPRPGAAREIYAAISDICISLKAEDYLSLPEITYQDIPVQLDSTAAAAYRRLEREAVLQVLEDSGEEAGTITAGTAAVLSNKLLQLCNGAVYDEAGAVQEIHSCKLAAFLEAVEALQGEHALVFYTYRHDLQRLQAAITAAAPGARVRTYSTDEDLQAWNAGEVDLLLVHPASCCYGLNLQGGGHHVIWFGLTWSLEQYQQANKCLHRQGQPFPVIVHHLVVQGGMDEDVMRSLQAKDRSQEALLQALKARIDRATGG